MSQRSMLDHWESVSDTYSKLMEFLEWLESKDIHLDTDLVDQDEFPRLDDLKHSALIDRYLQVDRRQLDNERRELLAQL
jgi:hypothetical protein